MNATFQWEQRLAGLARPLFGSSAVRFLAYLGLCAAYLQGGLVKLTDFPGALAEMAHFGLAPGPVFAVLVIVLELLASAMILVGRLRWLGRWRWPPSRWWPRALRCAIGKWRPGRSASWPPMRSMSIWGWRGDCCWWRGWICASRIRTTRCIEPAAD